MSRHPLPPVIDSASGRPLPGTGLELEIPFFDTDPMGVTWHGHYVKYFELARCELLKKIDFGYREMAASGFSWPVVDLRLKYVKPCRFGDRIRVSAQLAEYENRLRINYLIHNQAGNQVLTRGHSIQVAVDGSGGLCLHSPEILLQRVRSAL
ncbi:acyl-CoA thioesterase [Aestuariirhabdus litorea]|uniref:Acyl-CoA thioesterase n=1 Tax=Aestuariirhabdus litorea TaxID=2528527 RepID=A0A3P3VKD7_9GAMM|nr:acyl-CoA thioesterase [Aestuariirhabdus litorea]RRJ82777.1 acyl-CoA thioesterase [Aestuariirhabdus litorea]RWW92937.1 acyl-CoA thioesterase [Endozoicomonadaceae bacterium GTF-13]